MRMILFAFAACIVFVAGPATAGSLGCAIGVPCVVGAALPDGSVIVRVGDFTIADLKYNPNRHRYFAFNGDGHFDVKEKANPFDMVIDIADRLGGLNYDFLTPPSTPDGLRRMVRERARRR